jgi:hypothetical protein
MDNDDKLYCFWNHVYQNGTTFYRILENGIWGEIKIPYNNNDNVFIMKGVVDSSNNIYCTGSHHFEGQNAYDLRAISFNFINEVWTDYIQLSNNTTWGGNDISLSESNNPAIVWGQRINDSTLPNDGTLVSIFNGENWSVPELIAENADEQAITYDKNKKLHIIDNEKFDNGYKLTHFQLVNNEWIGEIIEDDTFGNYYNKLISFNSFIYLISVKVNSTYPIYSSSIVLRKLEITTNIENNNTLYQIIFTIYPNPAHLNTTLLYTLKETKKQE